MIVLIAFISFALLINSKTSRFAFLPVLFALFTKLPCPSNLLKYAGDDIYYQEAIVNRGGLSDPLFQLLFHNIWLQTSSMYVVYLSVSLLMALLVLFSKLLLQTFPHLRLFNWSYPFLAISPMILTGAIRQNFGFLVALVIVVYLLLASSRSSFFSYSLIPIYIIGLFTHIATLLFAVLYVFIFNFYLKVASPNNFLIVLAPFNLLFNLKIYSFRFSSQISLSRLKALLLFLLFSSFLFISYFWLSPFFQQSLYNLFIPESSFSSVLHFTLVKKLFVCILLLCLSLMSCKSKSFELPLNNRLLSLLFFNAILSFSIFVLSLFFDPLLFPKFMRISTFLEISSLLYSSILIRPRVMFGITLILFLSTYFSALGRTDYQLFLDIPFFRLLSYCSL